MRSARVSTGAFMLLAAMAACGELTGPESPSTPTNVVATLASPTSVDLTWTPSPLNDGVISYSIYRNGNIVGESTTSSYTDTGLSAQTTYVYSVAANCVSGVVSDRSVETAASTVTTIDITPPRVISNQPPANFVGVSPAATATVTFSEPMDPVTINASTFTLRVTGGAAIAGTVTYTPATRIAEFRPAGSLPNPANITATITTGAKDLSGNALAAAFSWSFTTRDDSPPSVIATSPANGATGVPANTNVTVTFSEPMDAVTINSTNITLRVTSSGAAVAGTVSYNPTTRVATFAPSTPLTQSVSYTATVSTGVRDVAGNALPGPFVFAFTTGDTVAPTVVSTVPADLASGVATTTTISATFSEAMSASTINTTTFTVRPTASTTPLTGTVVYNLATNTANFTPASPLAGGTAYTATITTGATDASGNPLAVNKTWTFATADATPPVVTSVSPARDATGVAVSAVVQVTFSEPMDETTITPTNIVLRNTATSAVVPATVTYNAGTNVATLTPSGPLSNATNYTLTVTTGVRDAAGNPLVSAFTSSFTTAALADVTPPAVVSRTPTNAAINVATNTNITVTFSEPMDALTINGANIRLTVTAGGALVPATVTYAAGTNTATLDPTADLANNTGYTITVTTGVTDVAGNALPANSTSTFTTIADTTPPTVNSRTPTALTGVPRNTVVTVTFSEAMDLTTINGSTLTVVPVVGPAVAGVVSYNTTTRIATFTPNAILAAITPYTVTVTTGAKDLAGNGLTGNFTFSFTTAP